MLNNVYRSLVSRSADTEAYLTSNLPFESRESCLHSSTLVRTGILENNGCRQVGRVQTSVDESRQDHASVLLGLLTTPWLYVCMYVCMYVCLSIAARPQKIERPIGRD